MGQNIRILFMGTPSFAVPILEGLIQDGRALVAVMTRPPAKTGRKQILTPSPIHDCAQRHDITCHTPHTLDEDAINFIKKTSPHLIITAAYGLLLPARLLDIPPLGAVNVHASLLPRWRGATPIEHALIHNDKETGITLMRMTPQLDAGDIITQNSLIIDKEWNRQDLTHHLSLLAARMTRVYIGQLEQNTPPQERAQDETCVTYAPRLSFAARQLHFSWEGEKIMGFIRAFAPRPATWCDLKDNKDKILRLLILKASFMKKAHLTKTGMLTKDGIACKDGIIIPEQVKKAGGSEMNFASFMRGLPKGSYHASL